MNRNYVPVVLALLVVLGGCGAPGDNQLHYVKLFLTPVEQTDTGYETTVELVIDGKGAAFTLHDVELRFVAGNGTVMTTRTIDRVTEDTEPRSLTVTVPEPPSWIRIEVGSGTTNGELTLVELERNPDGTYTTRDKIIDLG